MDEAEYLSREEQVRQWLDEMLDASIDGDFKTVRKLAKKIHKLANNNQEKRIVN